jgi:ribonuclease HII
MPTFDFEKKYKGVVVGVDEAGCGPWAGPVVAAAVSFLTHDLPQAFLETLTDSKILTKKKRDLLFSLLQDMQGQQCSLGCGIASVEEIDRLNIRKASHLAMERAVGGLSLKPDFILVDGTGRPSWSYPCLPIIKGDFHSFSIAAASIIAKVTRDQMMEQLAKEYPVYGWERNAGYGTAEHQQALKTFGPTPHHRKSFAPVAKLLSA